MFRNVMFGWFLCWSATALFAQPIPVADQFQVNTYTTSDQRLPAVAATSPDGFIVVWQGPQIRGQLLDAEGLPNGTEFQVNSHTGASQGGVSIAPAPAGGFIVAWDCFCLTAVGSDSDGRSIQLRRFDAAGVALEDQLQVNTYTTGDQLQPTVATSPSGEFVVVWQSNGSAGSDVDGYSIQGRRFQPDGTPTGSQFQINSYTSGNQLLAPVNAKPNFSVAVGPSGEFVVVWYGNGSAGTDADGYSVQGRMFSSDGSPLESDFQINSFTTSDQRLASVAMGASGVFTVVWDRTFFDVAGQRFSADGSRLNQEFQVNSTTSAFSRYPSIKYAPGGEFVVAWVDSSSSGDIKGRQFGPHGTPAGQDFLISTYTTSYQFGPSLAVGAAGEFVVVWDSNGSGGSDASGYSIQGRRFKIVLFSDGFESGDTSAWSIVSSALL